MEGMPGWARWNANGGDYTVGVEDEVMLVEPKGWMLDNEFRALRERLSPELAERLQLETHAATIEFATAPAATASEVAAELASIRGLLADELASFGRAAAASGTHPFASWQETEISAERRYRYLHDTMRELARREPTFAMHVHVAVVDPEDAVRTLSRMRVHLPLLLGLSANSPFWQGRDSGMASTRTPIFQAFPRSGIPRAFENYEEYVEALDTMIACGAFPDPGFIWWDLRLQPALGTIEIRVMDSQTEPWRIAPLVALTQSLARFESLEAHAPTALRDAPELLEETGSGPRATASVPSCWIRSAAASGRWATWPSSPSSRCATTPATSAVRTSSSRSCGWSPSPRTSFSARSPAMRASWSA